MIKATPLFGQEIRIFDAEVFCNNKKYNQIQYILKSILYKFLEKVYACRTT